jgi:hypothetical protein
VRPLTREPVKHVEHPVVPCVMRAAHDEVIGPDMVGGIPAAAGGRTHPGPHAHGLSISADE